MPERTPFEISNPPRGLFSTWIGIVLLFLVFGLFVLAVFSAVPRGDDYEARRAKARAEKLKAVRDETEKSFSGYAWIDKNKGTVRLPIERAMELTLAELASKKPMPQNPIAAAEPLAAPSASPASSASPQSKAKASVSPSTSPTPTPISITGPKSEAHGQPAAAINPPSAPPGTQPGASTTPDATAGAPSAQAPQQSTPIPLPSMTPKQLPPAAKSPPPSASPGASASP